MRHYWPTPPRRHMPTSAAATTPVTAIQPILAALLVLTITGAVAVQAV